MQSVNGPVLPEPPRGPVKSTWKIYRSWIGNGGKRAGGMYVPPGQVATFDQVVDGSAWPQLMPFKCVQTFADYMWSGSLISYVNQLFRCCQHYAGLSFRLQGDKEALQKENEDLKKQVEAALAEVEELNANAGNPPKCMLNVLFFGPCCGFLQTSTLCMCFPLRHWCFALLTGDHGSADGTATPNTHRSANSRTRSRTNQYRRNNRSSTASFNIAGNRNKPAPKNKSRARNLQRKM